MVDPISTEQTPGSLNPEVAKEETAKEQVAKTFTQAELDQKIKDRLDRERKKFADYDTLKERSEKLKAFEDKDLPEIDRLKKEHEKASGAVKDLTTELTGIKLENAKLKALVKAGVQPEQLDGLLKRVAGTTEDEIVADVEELKALGWIGQKPATPEPKPQGLGTPTAKGDPAKAKTIREQLAEVTTQLSDPKTTYKERTALIDLSLQLNRRLSKGEV